MNRQKGIIKIVICRMLVSEGGFDSLISWLVKGKLIETLESWILNWYIDPN